MASLVFLFVVGCSAQGYTYTPNVTFSAAITINGHQTYQRMIGGGCSGAFGIACNQFGSAGLSPANQDLVTQILFDENIGGLSVVRNDIGSTMGSSSILGSCPTTTTEPLNFTALGNDSCQLNLTQTALKYNPELFVYADAWSAPGCFKTDGSEDNGGLICGVRGSNCTTDWRQQYANYLVEYVKLYEQEGIDISLLGAYNEPDFNPVTYASQLSDGFQAYDFLSVLYPTVKSSFPNTSVSCCDATGARQERNILYELSQAAGSNQVYDVATWHNYQSNPERPFNVQNNQQNLMTEWADGTGPWTPTWDESGQLAEGLQWALYMHNAFTNSDTSGYLHWWCAINASVSEGADNALVRLQEDEYFVAARLWAFANYFRFARPGSVRVDAQSNVENVYVSAYVNTNGSVAVPIINAAHFPYQVSVNLQGMNVSSATAYLTDNEHNVTMVGQTPVAGGMFQAMVEPRAAKTFFLQ